MRFVFGLLGAAFGICIACAILSLNDRFYGSGSGLALAIPVFLVAMAGGAFACIRLLARLRAAPVTRIHWRGTLTFASMAVVAPIVLSASAETWVSISERPPSDATLLRNFSAHRPKFDQIAGMLRDDGIESIDAKGAAGCERGKVIAPARLDQYKRLMKDTGIQVIGDFDSAVGVRYQYWTIDLETGDADDVKRGYFYASERPSDTDIETFSHIAGNWYLFDLDDPN